jgi:hypothetical protein
MSSPLTVHTPAAFTDAERQTMALLVDRALRTELTKLRAALAHDADALHPQLQCLRGQAVAMGVRAEQVPIARKDLWQQLPSAPNHNASDHESPLMSLMEE